MTDEPPLWEADPGRIYFMPDQPLLRPWVPLTSADLRNLADELDRLSYATSAITGQTRCDYSDQRIIEFRRMPGSADLVALVIGHEPPPPATPPEPK